MSNPALGVWPLSSSLAGQDRAGAVSFTMSGPERYLSGLWVEEGTINVVANPSAATDLTYWTSHLSGAITRVTSLPAPLPDAAGGITTAIQFEATSGISGSAQALMAIGVVAANSAKHTTAWYVYVPSAFSPTGLQIVLASFTGATGIVNGVVDLGIRDAWQRVNGFATPASGDLTGAISIRSFGTVLTGERLLVTGVQFEEKPYATSATPSTRAASSASISPAGILTPDSGSLAFRLTRKIDTGDIEYILNCGTDGDDRLRIYIDTDDRLRVAWDTGGALPQSVVSSSTIAVGTEYLVYTEWDGINIAMSLDAGTLVTGIRDVPLGSWGTDDLVLGP